MKTIPITKSFTLIEPGPVILITTNDGEKNNIMTISMDHGDGFFSEICHNNGSLELFL
jgi:hypothetical protein